MCQTSQAMWGLIDAGDVAAALQRGQLAGYGADVVEPEPVVPTNPPLTTPNVVLTPHVGSRTYESVERQAIMAVENMLRVLHGQTPHVPANTL
jgi:D-3-phosphoglycerate dehydrogenase / 2-oxoglutarate reductase